MVPASFSPSSGSADAGRSSPSVTSILTGLSRPASGPPGDTRVDDRSPGPRLQPTLSFTRSDSSSAPLAEASSVVRKGRVRAYQRVVPSVEKEQRANFNWFVATVAQHHLSGTQICRLANRFGLEGKGMVEGSWRRHVREFHKNPGAFMPQVRDPRIPADVDLATIARRSNGNFGLPIPEAPASTIAAPHAPDESDDSSSVEMTEATKTFIPRGPHRLHLHSGHPSRPALNWIVANAVDHRWNSAMTLSLLRQYDVPLLQDMTQGSLGEHMRSYRVLPREYIDRQRPAPLPAAFDFSRVDRTRIGHSTINALQDLLLRNPGISLDAFLTAGQSLPQQLSPMRLTQYYYSSSRPGQTTFVAANLPSSSGAGHATEATDPAEVEVDVSPEPMESMPFDHDGRPAFSTRSSPSTSAPSSPSRSLPPSPSPARAAAASPRIFVWTADLSNGSTSDESMLP